MLRPIWQQSCSELKTHWKLAVFCGSILIMAALYNILWIARPDYFRIQQDVNFLPIELIQRARDENFFSTKNSPQDFSIPDDASVVSQIKSTLEDARKLSANIVSKREELDAVSKKIGDREAAFQQSQLRQLEEYVSQQAAPFEAGVTAKAEEMRQLLQSRGVSSAEDLSSDAGIEYAQLNIQRAEIAVRAAKAKADAYDAALRDLTQFQNTPEQKDFIATLDRQRIIQKELFALQDQRLNKNGKIYDLLVQYRQQILTKLTFADFLYFSVGAATTATFGDIAPNYWIVRLLVCFQVLTSVVLMGLVVGDLSKGRPTASAA